LGTSFLRAEIRSVLAANRIELALLHIGVFGNMVRLQGVLRRAAGLPELTNEALESMEAEIRRLPGVRRVELHLTNWRRQDSAWKPVAAAVRETLVFDPHAGAAPLACSDETAAEVPAQGATRTARRASTFLPWDAT